MTVSFRYLGSKRVEIVRVVILASHACIEETSRGVRPMQPSIAIPIWESAKSTSVSHAT